ncbi:MAG: hypothetical protein IKC11_05820 [Clostridia bacterium]|nr:hypothetical protein [Clostridia bacterium]
MKLEIELVGVYDKANTLVVDEKVVKLKKKDGNTRYAVVETEKSKVDVAMYKAHHYVGKHWFWWQLLYFFVSVFGIFDIKQDKKMLVADCSFTVDVTGDTKVVLKRENFVDQGKFLKIETSSTIEEKSNIQYIDKEALKRHKKMKKAKIGIFAGVVVLAILLVILL